jgi:hypothetical protein
MKPSQISRRRVNKAPDPETADRERSSLADPPISDEEARNARVALCPRHGGIVGQRGEHFGDVFWCPTGEECFRYTKKRLYGLRPLNYPARGYA